MEQDRAKDWRELCKAAASELDPNKLMALVAKINAALDERDPKRNIAGKRQKNGEASFCGTVVVQGRLQ